MTTKIQTMCGSSLRAPLTEPVSHRCLRTAGRAAERGPSALLSCPVEPRASLPWCGHVDTAQARRRGTAAARTPVLSWPAFDAHPVDALVTGREGGRLDRAATPASTSGCTSATTTPRCVANRTVVARALGAALDDFVFCQQTHQPTVLVVTEEHRGRGARSLADAVPATDALVTTVPGIVLVVMVADCVPLVLFDPRRRVLACVHAGWGGTVRGVTPAAVAAMQQLGSDPADLVVGIGPSIAPDRYQVGADVVAAAAEAFPGQLDEVVRPDGTGAWTFDLWRANMLQLLAAGVPEQPHPSGRAGHRARHGVLQPSIRGSVRPVRGRRPADRGGPMSPEPLPGALSSTSGTRSTRPRTGSTAVTDWATATSRSRSSSPVAVTGRRPAVAAARPAAVPAGRCLLLQDGGAAGHRPGLDRADRAGADLPAAVLPRWSGRVRSPQRPGSVRSGDPRARAGRPRPLPGGRDGYPLGRRPLVPFGGGLDSIVSVELLRAARRRRGAVRRQPAGRPVRRHRGAGPGDRAADRAGRAADRRAGAALDRARLPQRARAGDRDHLGGGRRGGRARGPRRGGDVQRVVGVVGDAGRRRPRDQPPVLQERGVRDRPAGRSCARPIRGCPTTSRCSDRSPSSGSPSGSSTTRTYLLHFRSCNRAFHIDRSLRYDHWCGECDKCCFIDLILAPFVAAGGPGAGLRRGRAAGEPRAAADLPAAARPRAGRQAVGVRR